MTARASDADAPDSVAFANICTAIPHRHGSQQSWERKAVPVQAGCLGTTLTVVV
jgi:hypothetical protein